MSDPLKIGGERELDETLRQLLLRANTPEALGADPAELEPPPPELEERMARFLRDPFRAAQAGSRPLWRRVLKSVACAALAVAVALGGVVAASPQARAGVAHIVDVLITWTGRNTSFHFSGVQSEGTENGTWEPTYIPEGYEKTESFDLGDAHTLIFERADGAYIDFEYMPVEEGYMLDMDNEHADYRELEINGQKAYLLDSNTANKPSYLIWFNDSGTVVYNLMGWLSGEELTKIADSV